MQPFYITHSPSETKKVAKLLAKKILKKGPEKQATIIALVGSLGGGKTTFLQGFAKGLGIGEKILSPSFIILRKFQIPRIKFPVISKFQTAGSKQQFKNFYHLDCYRIKKAKEILDLGFKEIISDPQNIVTIEWADKIKKILPKDSLIIKFKFLSKNKREIKIYITPYFGDCWQKKIF